MPLTRLFALLVGCGFNIAQAQDAKTYHYESFYQRPVVKANHLAVEAKIQELRADYFYHLLSFVEWPENSDFENNRQIHICMIGDNALGDALYSLQKRLFRGRSIVVHISYGMPELTPCHIAYIGGHKRPFSDNIIRHLANRSVLTIGDTELFVRAGGMIGLVVRTDDEPSAGEISGAKESKIISTLNLRISREAGFRFSAEFLEVATIYVDTFR